MLYFILIILLKYNCKENDFWLQLKNLGLYNGNGN